jgi:hypothetical protein
VIGFNLKEFKDFIAQTKWFWFGVMIITFALGILEWEFLLRFSGKDWISPSETFLDGLYILAFLLSFLAFERFVPPYSAKIIILGSMSYGIYLAHSLVLEVTARVIYHLVPGILAYQFLLQPILIVMGLGVPVLLMKLMSWSPARRYYEYVFG